MNFKGMIGESQIFANITKGFQTIFESVNEDDQEQQAQGAEAQAGAEGQAQGAETQGAEAAQATGAEGQAQGGEAQSADAQGQEQQAAGSDAEAANTAPTQVNEIREAYDDELTKVGVALQEFRSRLWRYHRNTVGIDDREAFHKCMDAVEKAFDEYCKSVKRTDEGAIGAAIGGAAGAAIGGMFGHPIAGAAAGAALGESEKDDAEKDEPKKGGEPRFFNRDELVKRFRKSRKFGDRKASGSIAEKPLKPRFPED